MPEGKVEPYANGALALLHELAGHVVYCCNVIGIDRMAQSQTISEKRGTKRHGEAPEARQSPNPDQNIEQREERVNAEQATPKADCAGQDPECRTRHGLPLCSEPARAQVRATARERTGGPPVR